MAGNVFALLRDTRGFVTERYLELGPVFRVRVMSRRDETQPSMQFTLHCDGAPSTGRAVWRGANYPAYPAATSTIGGE